MLSEADIRKIIEPHYPAFEQSYRDGMTDYATKYDETRHIHSARTRANLLRDHVVDHARQRFDGRVGASVIEKSNGLFCIELDGKCVGVDGSVAVRFKKLKDGLLTSNILTQQAIDFNEQGIVFPMPMQLELFDVHCNIDRPEPVHLNAGYIPNALWTDFKGLFITCPNGKRSIAWFARISGVAGVSRATLIELPLQTTIEEPSPRRVRARNGGERKRVVGDGTNS